MNRPFASLLAGALAGSVVPVAPAIAGPAPAAVTAVGASARQSILDQDTRLEKPVTLRLKKSPLSAVVAELGQQSGVVLKAAPGVADEPAIVYATDQPAKEVMHQVARLFHYRWTRKGMPGQYSYEIYQDLNSKQEEEALRDRRRTLALQGLRTAMSRRFALAGRSPEQLAREAAGYEEALVPFERLPKELRALAALTPAARVAEQAGARAYQLREMADPFRRALLRVPAGLAPAQWNALAAGETLILSTRQEPGTLPLPTTAASALRSARPSLLPPGVRFGFASREDEASCREVEQQSAQAWGQAESVRLTVRLSLPADAGSSQAVLTITPAAQMAAGYAGPLPSLPALIVVGDRPAAAGAEMAAAPETAPAVGPAWEADPVLSARQPFKVSLSATAGEAEVGTLNQVLPQIAETYGINLVADAYRAEPLPLPDLTAGAEGRPGAPEAGLRRLYEVLNVLVYPTARWSQEGAFLQVRRRTWAHNRVAEIPARVVKAWAAHFRKVRRLSLDETASLVLTLRDEQLAQFESVMQEHGVGVSLLFDSGAVEPTRLQAILRAYGSLLPLLRQTLRAGDAVPVAAMAPEARRWLRLALQSQPGAAAAAAPGGGIDGVLTLTREPSFEDDDDDPAGRGADAGEEPRAAAAEARAREADLHGVVFRFISQENHVETVSVALPRVHREPPAAGDRG